MDLSAFHFAHPFWLLGIIALSGVWILYIFLYQNYAPMEPLEKFIDKHLIPYLVINQKKENLWKSLLIWSLVSSFLLIALASPRWSFKEVETFSRDQSLVVLLDLSDSMNAEDIKPSRLIRAKQKIEDIIYSSEGLKIGLIGFAADPHMITPLTEDKQTVLQMLPALSTDIVYVQGSRLTPALQMALLMLDAESGNNKAILVMSDGGFEDGSALSLAKKIAAKGIIIHAMGLGTVDGAPIYDRNGVIIKKNGSPVLSKLDAEKMTEISKIGGGQYLEGDYSEFLHEIEAEEKQEKTHRFWDERFYITVIPILPIMLWWFRRGYAIVALVLFCSFTFKNSEQLGEMDFNKGEFESAASSFQDPYRKGVACYKAGNYSEAEKCFKASSREEVACSAGYNLGNSLALQQKYQEAITAYEEVLKKWPDHTKAKENLEIVKKLLEEEEPPPQNPPPSESPNNDKEEKENEKEEEERSEEEQQADQWLNQITNDQEKFMKNKFYIESKKNGTKGGIEPW